MPGKYFIINAALLLGLAIIQPPVYGDELRDKVVAGFVFNFIKFTEWPALPENAPLNLCVAAPPEMFSLFNEFAGKTVIGRHLQVFDAQSAEGACQVLFVAQGASPSCDCRCLDGSPQLLLISDNPGFTERCGVIGLYEEDNRLRFEVNLVNARRSGIRLGSQLLRLARILKGNSQ